MSENFLVKRKRERELWMGEIYLVKVNKVNKVSKV